MRTTARTMLALLLISSLLLLSSGCRRDRPFAHCWTKDAKRCLEFSGRDTLANNIAVGLYCFGRDVDNGACDKTGSTGSCGTGRITSDDPDNTVIVTTYYYVDPAPTCSSKHDAGPDTGAPDVGVDSSPDTGAD